jgi:hypothetical protein
MPFDPAPKVARPLVSSGLLRFKKDATYITQAGHAVRPPAQEGAIPSAKFFYAGLPEGL